MCTQTHTHVTETPQPEDNEALHVRRRRPYAFHTSTHTKPPGEIETHAQWLASPRIALAHPTTTTTTTTTTITTSTSTSSPQLRATLRLPGCACDRRAHKVLARRERLLHGAHWRAGGGLDVKASDATALAGEAHLLRVVVRVKAMAMARASVEMRLGFGAGARDRGEGEARTSVRLCFLWGQRRRLHGLRPAALLGRAWRRGKVSDKGGLPPFRAQQRHLQGERGACTAHARRTHGERVSR